MKNWKWEKGKRALLWAFQPDYPVYRKMKGSLSFNENSPWSKSLKSKSTEIRLIMLFKHPSLCIEGALFRNFMQDNTKITVCCRNYWKVYCQRLILALTVAQNRKLLVLKYLCSVQSSFEETFWELSWSLDTWQGLIILDLCYISFLFFTKLHHVQLFVVQTILNFSSPF